MEQERHLYSIHNQRISLNEEFPLLWLCFRSARAWHSLLAERHTEKRKVLKEKKSGFPFVTKSPILDPSRVFHSLAWCKRLLAGPFSSPSRIRCGMVLVTLLVAATASHLNAASSVFLLKLKASATWLVRQSGRLTHHINQTWQVCLACHRPRFGVSFFWVRKSLVATLSVLTRNRDPPPRSQVVHYCCHLLLLDHAFRSH